MPYLSKLSVVKDLQNINADPIQSRRSKLISRLREQKEMAQSLIDNKPFMKYHAIWISDPETGEKIKKQLPRKMRQWYRELDGTWYFQCNYGNRKLKLKNNMTTIQVGELDKLIPTIDIVISAVESGELDKELGDAYTRKVV